MTTRMLGAVIAVAAIVAVAAVLLVGSSGGRADVTHATPDGMPMDGATHSTATHTMGDGSTMSGDMPGR